MSRRIEYHVVSYGYGGWAWNGKVWDNALDAYEWANAQNYEKFKIEKDTYTYTKKVVMKGGRNA